MSMQRRADFRGSRGLTKETLNYLVRRGAIDDLNDAVDRYGAWGAPQLVSRLYCLLLVWVHSC